MTVSTGAQNSGPLPPGYPAYPEGAGAQYPPQQTGHQDVGPSSSYPYPLANPEAPPSGYPYNAAAASSAAPAGYPYPSTGPYPSSSPAAAAAAESAAYLPESQKPAPYLDPSASTAQPYPTAAMGVPISTPPYGQAAAGQYPYPPPMGGVTYSPMQVTSDPAAYQTTQQQIDGTNTRCACTPGWVLFAIGFFIWPCWVAAAFVPLCTKDINDRRAALASTVCMVITAIIILAVTLTGSRNQWVWIG